MTPNELYVVPGERQVERLARDGLRAETRTSLRSRLAAALLPDVAFMDPRECRLVLGVALADEETPGSAGTTSSAAAPEAAAQLDLFGGALPSRATVASEGQQARGETTLQSVVVARGTTAPKAPKAPRAPKAPEAPIQTGGIAAKDALLSTVRGRGGASWARLVIALDDAIALLRVRGATAEHLERVGRMKGFLATRARTLATAMRALDRRLARGNAQDGRLVGALLARAIAVSDVEALETLLGAKRLRARWLLAWDPADVAWWRALDDKLAPRGGGARVVLPTFDRPLASARERDPLDTLADELARGLDAPTESETIPSVLGDLSGVTHPDAGAPVDLARARIIGASDAVAQARAVATEVVRALEGGAAVERVVVALPSMNDRTLAPLRRAFENEGLVFHEARGPLPSHAPVVVAALLALDASASLDRFVVARLLRSGWIDATRLAGGDAREQHSRREAERSLSRLAAALETSPTAAGDDAVERLVRTALAPAARRGNPGRRGNRRGEALAEEERDASLAAKLGDVLTASRQARTRAEQVQAARSLWAQLGIGQKAGRGALATFTSDAAPEGVPKAERLAIARDSRAWDALVAALDLHESAASRVGALDQPLDVTAFRLELVDLLDAAASQPGAGRAAAVRVARLADVVGDELDLLVVVDVNEGVLPRDDLNEALVSESLAEVVASASRGVFVPPAPGASRARDLAALAVAAADARAVVLVFPREDAAGSPLAPSPVVDALVRAGVLVEPAEPEPVRASGLDVHVRVSREREREAFFLDASRPLSDVVGDLAPAASASRLLSNETGGAERPLAVTGLERFARCAFMGYAHVVLAARETEHKDELPDAREEGTLIHEALAAAFVATSALWPRRPRPSDEIASAGVATADALLDGWQGHAALRAVVRLRVSDAVRAVLAAAIEDEAWDFSVAEQSFGDRPHSGDNDSWPPFAISEGDLTLALRGSIDRLDRGHDGRSLRVIDYKRSKSTVTAAGSSLGETALQVPLYACVAARELGLPATGAYVPTQARDVAFDSKPSARAVQRMEELVGRPDGALFAPIERRALAVVASARAGALAPLPARESECRFCAVSGGCRKPRFAMTPLDDAEEDRETPNAPKDAL